MGDMSGIDTKDGLQRAIEGNYPETKHKARLNWTSQLWPFIKGIEKGDIVALPLKQRPAIAFGRVVGPYRFDGDAPGGAKHQRPVEWLKEVPRSEISKDLLYSLGAFMTVARMTRNDAEKRLLALIEGKGDPVVDGKLNQLERKDIESQEESDVDMEAVAKEQIRQRIYAQFKGHGLARLVGAVLTAQGYQVTVSPEGADGGVDVIAGSGPMGFGSPRIIAQVKSDQGAIDVKVVRELQGVMKQFGADHGLVVAWGGFKGSVVREMARQFFEIRLWTGDDLVQALLDHYDVLPADLRAELPLKRVWTLALGES